MPDERVVEGDRDVRLTLRRLHAELRDERRVEVRLHGPALDVGLGERRQGHVDGGHLMVVNAALRSAVDSGRAIDAAGHVAPGAGEAHPGVVLGVHGAAPLREGALDVHAVTVLDVVATAAEPGRLGFLEIEERRIGGLVAGAACGCDDGPRSTSSLPEVSCALWSPVTALVV